MNDRTITLELTPEQAHLLTAVLALLEARGTELVGQGDATGYADHAGSEDAPGITWDATQWEAIGELRRLVESRTPMPA